VLSEALLEGPAPGPPNHAHVLLPEIERQVDAAGGWERVDLIAVGLGPGSYTGLRIGLATARGFSLALGKPLAGVDSLSALARGIAAAEDGERELLPAIDARRGELFVSLFGSDGAQRWGPTVLSPDALAARLAAGGSAPLAAGSGALRFQRELEAVGVEVLAETSAAHRIAARHICALSGQPAARARELVPLYLRAPDAERWIERDSARAKS
jgi:tRNA threonylcarbamoyladenosine biosynthesis protein TsaB